MKEITKKFGALMRAHRNALGLSQTNVAKQLGISQQAYGRYENGDREPDLDQIVKISRALEIDLSAFFADVIGDENVNKDN